MSILADIPVDPIYLRVLVKRGYCVNLYKCRSVSALARVYIHDAHGHMSTRKIIVFLVKVDTRLHTHCFAFNDPL